MSLGLINCYSLWVEHSFGFVTQAVLNVVCSSWSGPSIKSNIAGYCHEVCITIALAYLADMTLLQNKGFAAGLVLIYFLWQCAEYHSITKMLACMCIGSMQAQTCFPMFSESCRFYLYQWDLTITFWRATYCLNNSLDCLFPYKPSGQQGNQVQPNPSTRSFIWGQEIESRNSSLHPHYLRISFMLPFCICIFRKLLMYQVSVVLHKWHLILGVSPIFPPSSSFSPPSPLDPPLPVPHIHS